MNQFLKDKYRSNFSYKCPTIKIKTFIERYKQPNTKWQHSRGAAVGHISPKRSHAHATVHAIIIFNKVYLHDCAWWCGHTVQYRAVFFFFFFKTRKNITYRMWGSVVRKMNARMHIKSRMMSFFSPLHQVSPSDIKSALMISPNCAHNVTGCCFVCCSK